MIYWNQNLVYFVSLINNVMEFKIKDVKVRFFIKWSLWSTLLIPIGAILAFVININVQGKLGYGGEIGPPWLQTAAYCNLMLVMGALIGIMQWILLQRLFKIHWLWILTCIAGGVIGEILAGIILWEMGINRADLGWAQGGSVLAEATIFLLSGALIGLIQYPLLKKHYNKAGLWILGCSIGWALIPIVIYFFGGIVLGAITGATLMWILQPKDIKSVSIQSNVD